MFRALLLLLALAGALGLQAQVIIANPAFPNVNNQVTITFDAAQGTAGLANCNCDVYVHTGVITNNSTSSSDWRYVPTTWGQANAAWRMTPVPGQPNKYTYTIGPSIRQYYNVPAGEQVLKLAFVFRNASGSLEGKGPGGTDIFYDVYPENVGLTTSLNSPSATNLDIAIGQFINISGVASRPSTLSLYQDGSLLTSTPNATTLNYDLRALLPGPHTVELIAIDGQDTDTSRFTYTAEYRIVLSQPAQPVVLTTAGANINVQANAYIESGIKLFVDGALQNQVSNSATFSGSVTASGSGAHLIELAAEYNNLRDTARFVYVIPGAVNVAEPPAGFDDGITYLPDGRLYFQLYAPNKQVIFLIGDFNDWTPTLQHQLNRSPDGATWWIYLQGLTPGQSYGMQYLVDGSIRIADPYSTLVLDRFNDPFIAAETWPNLPAYPVGKTDGIVTLLQPGAPEYEWQVDDFTPPAKSKLVIYELLVRDFIDRHDYLTLIDTLDYLSRLGVNAIELMPVSEFEGNLSWGYNPSFHMALDKYYGTPNHFKQFIDACHARGIAVIVDVVYNHAFSQSPLAQLYWDQPNFRPSPDNPWLNPTARHPFNVGYDFNHESPATRKYVDQVMRYWLSEFRIDGFRFDLSKGFTQRQSNDVNAWNAYDANRIATLKHYADVMWAVNPAAYVILEHFAVNTEETELQAYGNGMLFWGGGGIHNLYIDVTRGVNANLSSASYTSRGWTQPNLIPYMESHDEERLMVKNLNEGAASGTYNIRNILTAMRRVELSSVFFYTLPGPKMLWQFGELGYDYSINYCLDGTISDGCRTGNKPIRWDYYQSPNRRRIFDVTSALVQLKTNYEAFSTTNFSQSVNNPVKRITLNHPTMTVVALGNFGLTTADAPMPFFFGGTWYEYFTGDSLIVSNPNNPISLAAGEYRLYTNVRLDAPSSGYITATGDVELAQLGLAVSPNPTQGPLNVSYTLPAPASVQLTVFNALGQPVTTLLQQRQPAGEQRHEFQLNLPAGRYYLALVSGRQLQTLPFVVQ